MMEFWIRLTILLRLVSISFAIPSVLHSRIMRAVRNGDVQDLGHVIGIEPACLRKFKVEYWSMALKMWSSQPDSESRKRIVTILKNELRDKNEKRMGMTPLICAVKFGHRQAVSEMLRVTSIDGRNNRGQTALIVAIKYGLLEIAEELLDRGADANIYDEKKRSAMHYACMISDQDRREEAILLLLTYYAEVSLMKCPYAIIYERVDVDKILRFDLVRDVMNADELIVRRILLEVEEIGLTLASAMFLMAFASISRSFSDS